MMKSEFGSIEKPRIEADAPPKERPSFPRTFSRRKSAKDLFHTISLEPLRSRSPGGSPAQAQLLYEGAELSEFVDATGDWSIEATEDIVGWEVD